MPPHLSPALQLGSLLLSPHYPGHPWSKGRRHRAGASWVWHLMQGVSPHVAPRQGLIVGKDDGVILGVRLVAALANPAAMVREQVVEAPAADRGALGRDGRGPGAALGPHPLPWGPPWGSCLPSLPPQARMVPRPG